ncbi:MAG: DUF4129 domain-containing protein [Acidimicrobiales bacterium]
MADSAEELRQRADEILAQDRYNPQPGLLVRAWSWILDHLPSIRAPQMDTPVPPVAPSPIAGYVGVVIILVLVILAVLSVRRSGISWRFRRHRRAETDRPAVEVVRRIRPTTRDEWLRRARQADADRRYAEAVRAWGQATLTGLADREEIPAPVGHTVSELRRAYRSDQAGMAGLAETTERYSDVWYGGDPAGAGDSRRLEAIDRFLVVVDRAGRTGTVSAEDTVPTDDGTDR